MTNDKNNFTNIKHEGWYWAKQKNTQKSVFLLMKKVNWKWIFLKFVTKTAPGKLFFHMLTIKRTFIFVLSKSNENDKPITCTDIKKNTRKQQTL